MCEVSESIHCLFMLEAQFIFLWKVFKAIFILLLMVVKTAIQAIECIDLVTSSRVGSHLKSQLIRSD